MSQAVLKQIAEYFLSVGDCELFEEEDDLLSPLEILEKQYTSSDCGDFALALNELMRESVLVNFTLPGGFPIHVLVKDAEGRLIDFTGYTTLPRLRRKYGESKGEIHFAKEGLIIGCTEDFDEFDEDGDDPERLSAIGRARKVIENLPYEPFKSLAANSPVKQEVSGSGK